MDHFLGIAKAIRQSVALIKQIVEVADDGAKVLARGDGAPSADGVQAHRNRAFRQQRGGFIANNRVWMVDAENNKSSAIGGCLAGLAVATAAARLLLALAFQHTHFLPIGIAPSPTALGFSFALALLTGMIFGAAPAWVATRTDPGEVLRGSGRAISAHSSFASKTLLAVQACLSVVLVAGATMLARSLDKLENQDFGYQVNGRVLVGVNNPPATYTLPRLNALYRQLEDRLNRLPGVQGSGMALYNPLTNNWGEMIYVAGQSGAENGWGRRLLVGPRQ